ncbi:MAG: GldG family protein [Candidatus Cyclobacteriaceae bacterium M3_2C_046]
MKKSKVITQVLIVIAIVVVINLILNQLFFRIDFTADKRYTLSQASKEILRNMDDVITVTAYFSKDLPPQLIGSRQDFEDMLIEYENRSGGNLVYEFINPNESEELEAEAQQKGVSPVMVNVTERDQVKQMRAYMGAILQKGEETEVIPVVQPGSSLEYSLTTAIKKLAVEEKPKVAFIQGHGEPPVNASFQLVDQLSVLYDVEPYTIADTTTIPGFYQALVILDPKDTVPSSHLNQLDDYLKGGGSIFLAHSNLGGDLSNQYLQAGPDIGFKGWLQDKGINLNDQYVIDVNCGAVSVRQQQGPFVFNTQVEFPFFPVISNFPEHPATEGLESVILPFVSPISITPRDSAVNIMPLALTSSQSGAIPAPHMVDINREWEESDFTQSELPVAVAASGPLAGPAEARLAVITNGNFVVNGEGQQRQQVNPDNVNFASNIIDWLSDDTGLVELRTKGITSRPLDPIEETTKNLLKYGNVTFPILMILVLGFFRKQYYLRKRQNWIQGNY